MNLYFHSLYFHLIAFNDSWNHSIESYLTYQKCDVQLLSFPWCKAVSILRAPEDECHEISNLTKKEWEPTVPGYTCARAGGTQNFPEQQDLTLAFSPRNFLLGISWGNNSQQTELKQEWEERSNLVGARGKGGGTLTKGGESWSQDERKISDSVRLFTWECVSVETF